MLLNPNKGLNNHKRIADGDWVRSLVRVIEIESIACTSNSTKWHRLDLRSYIYWDQIKTGLICMLS